MTGRRFDLLVFDWDGTLMDSAAAIVASLQAACEDLGLPVPCEADARYVIGLGLGDAMAHVLPALPKADYARVADRYRHHFLARDAGTVLFTGARELIHELHSADFRLAVATGKSRRGLERALAATGLQTYFHATRCADEGLAKPNPEMLHCIMETLQVPPARTLMIGDTTHDMAMARSAGVARVALGHGAHPRDELLAFDPLVCVDGMAELRTWLRANA